jgi:Phospholipase_D-nuclease N-terminal/Short C-terminal domain
VASRLSFCGAVIYPQTERIHHLPFADVSFGDLLLTVFEIFLFVIWIYILFTIIGDIFRDHEMSGLAKAVWIIFLVFIPYISMLVYLIVRGSGMRERALKAQSEAKHHMDSYIQQQAHASPADELHKLNDLKEKGALSSEEFDRAKTKLLA